SKQIKEIDRRIKDLQEKIKEVDRYAPLVNDYIKDKRELFDKLPDFVQKKEDFVKQMNALTNDLEEANRKFNLKRMQINKEKRAIEEELIDINNGISYFSKHFRDTPVYNKYAEIIERAEPKKTNHSVMDVCSQLLQNDSHFNEEYGAFQRYVNEFSGKFRLENHFNFVIRNDASQAEYERFAQNVSNFIHENKIELSIAETATQIGLVTDS